MSKFNKTKTVEMTENLAGGKAFAQTPKVELASLLLTSFASDQYHRSEEDTVKRLNALMDAIPDKKFCAKAAIYARTKFGMRSITHILAADMAKHASGKEWAKNFYQQIVYRPDDITEILAYHIGNKRGPLSNAMKKGLGAAFGKFDEYELAKYRGEGKAVKLVDAVNLLHPKEPKGALKKLIEGTLKNKKTWEAKLTKAGQEAETEEEKEEMKAEVWKDLLKTGKLGYFALLRNLRNIIEQAPDVLDLALEQLVDPKRVKNSLVLPFRYLTASEQIGAINSPEARKAIRAISKAIDVSCANVPKFEGDTLIVVDHSASMHGRNVDSAALFMAVLAKSNDADCMVFGSSAEYVMVNSDDSTLTIADRIRNNCTVGHGTDFHRIFETANKAYDRIIVISDMQGWMHGGAPVMGEREYRKRTGADPYIYSFDLSGYGSTMFPPGKTYMLAGFSDKTFDLMKKLETDRNAMVNEIEAIQL